MLLVQAEPPDDIQDFNFPMGYASLDSVLTRDGHEVEILFTVADHLTDAELARRFKGTDAQVIGIGGMFPYLKRVERLVGMVKEIRPDITVVLGGWMVTYCPELALKKTGADFCISGDGEISFSKLISALENKTDYTGIQGLVFKQDGRVFNNGMSEHIRLEDIPMPNWDKFPMSYYMRIGWYFNSFCAGYDRIMGWAASRGCPGKCNFCTPGHRVRYKGIEHLRGELREIVDRFHPTFLYWMDNLTMASASYTKRFCEMLIEEKFNFRYFATGRVDRIDRESLRMLKESGCACILYGLESANNEILKFMNKNTTVEQVNEALRLTKEAGIGVNVSAMFGQPMETVQDFYNTVKVIMSTSDRRMPYSNNQGFYPLTTFPGSPIFYWAKEKGYIKDDDDFYDQFFSDRWINFTSYPREIVEKMLNVANLLNTWNFHKSKSLSLEDSLIAMRLPQAGIGGTVRSLAERAVRQVEARSPGARERLKAFVKARPLLYRWVMRILVPGKAKPPLLENPSGLSASTTGTHDTSTLIDPAWPPQRQLDVFIDRLMEEYFRWGRGGLAALREEGGHLAAVAEVYYQSSDYASAIQYFRLALEKAPADVKILGLLGWACHYSRRYDEAIDAFQEAIHLQPDNDLALRGLGWAYSQTGRHNQASKTFDRALEFIDLRNRDLVQETHRGRGWALYHTGRFQEALADFSVAIENSDPSNKGLMEDLTYGRSLTQQALGRNGAATGGVKTA